MMTSSSAEPQQDPTLQFFPKYCFDQVHANVDNFDNIYCGGNAIIMILSLVNATIFIYLTVLHFRSNRMTRTYGEIFCKVKSSILISLSVFEIIVWGRYTLYFTGEAYNAILICQQFLQSFILFQICYFYAKKAAHFVENSETLRKRMRIVMYIAVGSFVGIFLFEVISHIT